jgi:hypothetical protein
VRTRACFAVALTLALAGCGGQSASDVLSQTANKLGKVRSGDLTLVLSVGTRDGKKVGFELRGPFALAKPGGLPVAKVTFTRLGAQAQPPVTVISTGQKAFVDFGGKTYELPSSRLGRLRSAAPSGSGGLQRLDIGKWVKDAKLSAGGTVEGVETDRIHADLDVVQAMNDLLSVGASFGAGGGGRITGQDAEQLRRAVKSATIDVDTGKDDRLLRRLRIHVDLRANAPARVQRMLGALGEIDVRFELSVGHPNEPVHVQAPAHAEPLPSG